MFLVRWKGVVLVMETMLVLFGSMAFFLVIGVPIAICIGLAVIATILFDGQLPLTILYQQTYQGLDSFTLLALPLFILAGDLMGRVGIIDDLLGVCEVFLGRVRGSLAHANILGSMLFAGISGSATADTAAIGGVLIPAMVKQGYDADFTVGVTASSSVIGPIIPPSIGFVLYGSTMMVSISALFVAGVVPGIMLGIALMIPTAYMSHKRNYPKTDKRYTLKQIVKALVRGIPAVIMPLIILGGILGGIFTPTEAAAAAVIYALLIGAFYYRSLNWKLTCECITQAMIGCGAVLLIVGLSYPFGGLVAMTQIPQAISEFLMGFTSSKYVLLLLINVFLLAMGCVMESNAILLICAPVLAPIAIAFGVDPVHFGVIFVLNIIIGLATPPFGMCLFIATGIAKIPLSKSMIAIIPFCIAEVIVLLLITYIPELCLFLPRFFGLI